VKIDATVSKVDPYSGGAGRLAADLESAGYDGVWVGETNHDPSLVLGDMARSTSRVDVGTAVMIAFARTPLLAAHTGYDMAGFSQGRFILGLGSQVKPHIERRYSMPWSHPAARMKEFVQALRAIWAGWHEGASLDFRGDYYTHNLMPPFFQPERHDWGPPPVFLAGVGERMTEVAGEVADGFFMHPFTTRRYLDEVTIPALKRGRSRSGARQDSLVIGGPSFVTVGRDEAEMESAWQGTKAQIAFYASTPAYRPVLDLHGWGDLQTELTKRSKTGRWSDMAELITDEIVSEFSVIGDPATVGQGLQAKLAGIADRVSLYTPYPLAPGLLGDLLDSLRA
jgi:probable F420-dependent oxidoreductase